jgi:hypothetical protein
VKTLKPLPTLLFLGGRLKGEEKSTILVFTEK